MGLLVLLGVFAGSSCSQEDLQHPGPRHGELSACPLTTAENQTPYLLNYALHLLDPTYIQLAEVFGPLTLECSAIRSRLPSSPRALHHPPYTDA